MTEAFTPASLLALKPYSLERNEKQAALLSRLNELSALHVANCEPYRRIVEGAFPAHGPAERLTDIPYLPVRIFKTHLLRSVPETAVYKTLTSSGTTGSMPSRITLDQETAQVQARLLINLLGDFVGKQRRPMLIVDAPPAGGKSVSARYAATLGVMNLGREHFFCLDESMALKKEELAAFLAKQTQPIMVFGFTFMLWKHLYEAVGETGIDLKEATVLHTGGWKKLLDQSVDNDAFKAGLRKRLNVGRVHNFYGMAEQVGTVFIECERGVLHASDGSDIIIRDERTWREVERGRTGLVQCLSALPTSYPGHSLLTEDIGTLLGDDDCGCGRKGRYFKIIGRVPSAELRGCSDTRS